MNKFKIMIAVAFAFGILLVGERVYAVPPLPSTHFGTVQVDGANVPDGTLVTAWIGGVAAGWTETISYGGSSVYALDVSGDPAWDPEAGPPATEGSTIVFRIGENTADELAAAGSSGLLGCPHPHREET